MLKTLADVAIFSIVISHADYKVIRLDEFLKRLICNAHFKCYLPRPFMAETRNFIGERKMKKIIVAFAILMILSCENPTESIINNYITTSWQGELSSHPSAPNAGWAYYNTSEGISYIWDGNTWHVLSQDGLGTIWQGTHPTPPVNPERNWAYFNVIDGNSYIYSGTDWELLAKSGRDGATGILLWLGSLATAPVSPVQGWAYYNTTNGISYIWDGDSWEILAQDGNDGDSIFWKGISNTNPLNPEIGWAYYNLTDNNSYIWNMEQHGIF